MTVANGIIKKQILNQRFVRSLAKTYRRDMKRLLDRVARRIEREPNNTRLQAIREDLERTLELGLQDLGRKITQDIEDFAVSETEYLTQLMELNSTVVLQAPDIGQIIRYLQRNELDTPTGPATLRLGEALAEFEKGQTNRIRRILIDGMLMNDNPSDMAKQIRELATGRSAAQVNALTRTLTNFASSQARKAFAVENSEVFDGEEWSAVLDSRTTLICGGRDGNVYPVGKGPYPPAHWNCRSVRIPTLKKDFQKIEQEENKRIWMEKQDESEFTLARSQGKRKDFDSWLRGQNKSFKQEYFSQFVNAEEKYALFEKGDLKLEQFRDETGKEYTLEQLQGLYPTAYRDADIEDS